MISLYSGTPGSGKSLHLAKDIFVSLKLYPYKLIISNIPIKLELFTQEQKDRFIFIPTEEITVSKIWEIGENWVNSHCELSLAKRENSVLLLLDEAQLLFNARSWMKNSSKGWPEFFSLHRHAGFRVILVTQMITALDKQVRGLIEFEYIHYKVKYMGLIGAILNCLALGGLFRYVVYWTPINERVDAHFFKYHKRYGELYDTHMIFNTPTFLSKENEKKENKKYNNKRIVNFNDNC